MGFRVRKHRCKTCIFGTRGNWNLEELLGQIRDPAGGFTGWRVCHHEQDEREERCCRGFWDKHKDDFQIGQVAQRLGVIREVD